MTSRPKISKEAWDTISKDFSNHGAFPFRLTPAECGVEISDEHSLLPGRSEEQSVLDALCKKSGYQRWWIHTGRLFFEREGSPGNIHVLLVPLKLVDFRTAKDAGQAGLFDEQGFAVECEGIAECDTGSALQATALKEGK